MLTVDFDRLGIGPSTKVIDVGCGAGRHAFEAYRRGADVIATDTWVSMGDEDSAAGRAGAFDAYQVNARTLELAAPGANVLHCLPAYRGKEITAEVLDGPQGATWRLKGEGS